MPCWSALLTSCFSRASCNKATHNETTKVHCSPRCRRRLRRHFPLAVFSAHSSAHGERERHTHTHVRLECARQQQQQQQQQREVRGEAWRDEVKLGEVRRGTSEAPVYRKSIAPRRLSHVKPRARGAPYVLWDHRRRVTTNKASARGHDGAQLVAESTKGGHFFFISGSARSLFPLPFSTHITCYMEAICCGDTAARARAREREKSSKRGDDCVTPDENCRDRFRWEKPGGKLARSRLILVPVPSRSTNVPCSSTDWTEGNNLH